MKAFFALIDRLLAAPTESRSDIERFIWESYEREMAVLALDMSSFSLSVRRNGVISHLCHIRRMQLLTEPIVHQFGGQVLKYEADNLLAVFDEAPQAVAAAVAMSDAVAASPDWCSCVPKLAVSIGIDWGPMLVLPGEDCFGDAVNIAFKLGEDVAGPAEVLITDRVRQRLGGDLPFRLTEQHLSVAGFDLTVYRVRSRKELVPAAAEAAAARRAK
jgi:class 3 adenylate cyclase